MVETENLGRLDIDQINIVPDPEKTESIDVKVLKALAAIESANTERYQFDVTFFLLMYNLFLDIQSNPQLKAYILGLNDRTKFNSFRTTILVFHEFLERFIKRNYKETDVIEIKQVFGPGIEELLPLMRAYSVALNSSFYNLPALQLENTSQGKALIAKIKDTIVMGLERIKNQ